MAHVYLSFAGYIVGELHSKWKEVLGPFVPVILIVPTASFSPQVYNKILLGMLLSTSVHFSITKHLSSSLFLI